VEDVREALSIKECLGGEKYLLAVHIVIDCGQ
jgi:hypothetical protein